MGNLTKFIPRQSLTVKRIFEEYKKAGDSEPTRGYLGASIIGHPCGRFLWYCFRQCAGGSKPEGFSGRMRRLFETGDLAEARFTKNLRDIGCEVHDANTDGKQFEVFALGGHFSGHMDGCALGIPEAPKTWHVLEYKTHSAKSFRKLEKDGVQKSKPQHYAQFQVYMHLTGMTRTLYLATNKDTDDLYAERIRYNKAFAEGLIEKAKRIITANSPPERAFNRRDYYECGWCDARSICWGATSPEPTLSVQSLSCRQCCHSTPDIHINGANWHCSKFEAPVSDVKPCEHHLCLPGLFPFAKPTNHWTDKEGYSLIELTNEDGTVWHHGHGDGAFSSKELMKLPTAELTNPIVSSIKRIFKAEVTGCQSDILARYPKEDVEIIWEGRESELIQAWMETFHEDLGKLGPVATCSFVDYSVAELSGGRVAIAWHHKKKAEIRRSKE